MTRVATRLGALAAVVMLSAAALPAQAEPDMASIQAQIDQMKADYEARIAALEARVEAAESRADAATADAPTRTAAADAPAERPVEVAASDLPDEAPIEAPDYSASPIVSASAQNPGVSVILSGNYVFDSRDPALGRIPGFELADETGRPDRGFSLAESELTFAANIDPFFYGSLTIAFDGQGEAAVEEAYVQTTALPSGLTAKAGRFFSGVGYLNERHAHTWSFLDMPLPYRAFLGGQYGDDGVQLRWLAPTDIFMEFGVEAFRGDSFPGGNAANRGNGTLAAYVHTGADLNESWSWLAAASYLRSESDGRETEDPFNGIDVFDGTTDLGVVSGVLKWAPGGNVKLANVTLSAEYFFGNERGDFNGAPVDLDRSGFYAQGVYMFVPQWSIGVRYSQLSGDNPGPLLVGSTLDPQGNDPWSATALLEYDSSEFGRFRIQYTRDESNLLKADQLWFQYTVAYGPHGAHRY